MKAKIIHLSLAMTLAVTALPAAAMAQSGAAAVTAEAAPVESAGYKQARLTAEAILKSKYPFAVAEAVHTPHPNQEIQLGSDDVQYIVKFERHLNGIPYPENQISMLINSRGSSVSEQITWHKKAFLSTKKLNITAEEGPQEFLEKSKLLLRPITPSMFQPSNIKYLSASLDTHQKLDAVTGKMEEEFILQTGNSLASGKLISDKPLAAPAITPLHTAEQAAAQVKKYISNSPQYTLSEPLLAKFSHNENKPDPAWRINGLDRSDPAYSKTFSVEILQSTGELIHLSTSGDTVSTSKELSFDDARKTASELIIKSVPQMANKLYESGASLSQGFYSFSYQPAVSSGEVAGGYIHVTVNQTTGKVTWYEDKLTDDSVSSKPRLPEAELKAALQPEYDIRLTGMTVTPDAKVLDAWKQQLAANRTELITDTPVEVKLVYSAEPKATSNREYFLDASDGKWKHFWDATLQGETNRPTSYRP